MSRQAPDAQAPLQAWLDWQSSLHPREMDLGLDRVVAVAEALELLPVAAQVFTVAGTNGKGSCALTLERLLRDDLRTGTYTSPYLLRYNERVRIGGREASDDDLCRAFAAVEAARGDVALTYFEFGTLAALWLFADAAVDVMILEVGMGGRLDAVNVIDPDVAVITSIALDHTQWLGDSRESIGHEKAGIMRAGKPVICADQVPPASIGAHAESIGARLLQIGRDFDLHDDASGWLWRSDSGRQLVLPVFQALLPDNLAAVLAALEQGGRLPPRDIIAKRLADFQVPGRRQQLDGPVPVVLDVAHNPAAMALLSAWLRERPIAGRTIAVLGMLRDKAISECAGLLNDATNEIVAAALPGVDRGASERELREHLPGRVVHPDVGQALRAALACATPRDRVVVCGSFFTVSAAYEVLRDSGYQVVDTI